MWDDIEVMGVGRGPEEESHEIPSYNFSWHKENTASDIEAIISTLQSLTVDTRDGDMDKFERFFIAGGTEDGDSRLNAIIETLVFRYINRKELLYESNK